MDPLPGREKICSASVVNRLKFVVGQCPLYES